MPIPNQRCDLESFGYSFLSHSHCSGCNAEIEWWWTPNGAKLCFNVTRSGENEFMEPHWATCPVADRFRRPK
jgi:hypothetical protein